MLMIADAWLRAAPDEALEDWGARVEKAFDAAFPDPDEPRRLGRKGHPDDSIEPSPGNTSSSALKAPETRPTRLRNARVTTAAQSRGGSVQLANAVTCLRAEEEGRARAKCPPAERLPYGGRLPEDRTAGPLVRRGRLRSAHTPCSRAPRRSLPKITADPRAAALSSPS